MDYNTYQKRTSDFKIVAKCGCEFTLGPCHTTTVTNWALQLIASKLYKNCHEHGGAMAWPPKDNR